MPKTIADINRERHARLKEQGIRKRNIYLNNNVWGEFKKIPARNDSDRFYILMRFYDSVAIEVQND